MIQYLLAQDLLVDMYQEHYNSRTLKFLLVTIVLPWQGDLMHCISSTRQNHGSSIFPVPPMAASSNLAQEPAAYGLVADLPI